MPHGDYAECPQCGVTAYGKEEIEEVFGYRYNGAIPQSWCRECRSKERRSVLGTLLGRGQTSDEEDD